MAKLLRRRSLTLNAFKALGALSSLNALPWLAARSAYAQTAPTSAPTSRIAPGTTSGVTSAAAVAEDTEPDNASPLARSLKAQRLPSDGIVLDFPRLADTGNAVPLVIDVQAPTGLTVVALEILLPENPNPNALLLALPEPLISYRFSTRLRLAASQDAWVIVRYSDGSRRAAHAPTIITSSACFDGT
jgi:predicted secreted protein